MIKLTTKDKLTTKEDIALLVEEASEMFEETGCVPDVDGKKVRAEKIVPRSAPSPMTVFFEGGAMNFIENKSAIITGEYWIRVYRWSQLRPVVVRWPTLFRPRLGV